MSESLQAGVSRRLLSGPGRLVAVTVAAITFLAVGAVVTPALADAAVRVNSGSVVGTDTRGINPDAYSCSQPNYVNFESFPEGYNLSANAVSGVQFTTTDGYTWLVADFASGNYNGKYPDGDYTGQGTHVAWLGVSQGAGRIDFPNGAASYFSLLTSETTPVEVDAYDASNTLLAVAGPATPNLDTGTMDQLAVTSSSANIAYVIVHDHGNYFDVDSICTDAPMYGVPGSPLGVSALPGSSAATVSWSPPTHPGATPITSYTATASPGGQICSAASTTCTVTGLTVGTQYTFTVTATNGAGTGPASAPSNVVTPYTTPGAPTAVAASAGDSQAVVYWTAPANDGGVTITSYTAVVSPGGNSCSAAATFCTVTGLSNGTSYTFTVTATNAAGAGPASSPSLAIVPAAVPSMPTGVTLTPGSGSIGVGWSAASGNGSAVTSYTATASPGGASCSTAGLSCTISGLTQGAAYTVTVTATNGVGTGPASTPAGPVVVPGLPGAPTAASAIGGDAQATVSWTAANPNGSPIVSYTVTASDSTTPGDGGQTCVTASSSCTLTGLNPGDSYTFTVTATNGVGTGPASSPSNAVTPDGTAPTVTSGPIYSVVPGSSLPSTSKTASVPVTVSWTGTAGSAAICSYTVQLSTNGGAWSPVTLGSPTATSSTNMFVYQTIYQYRVQAVGCDGLVSAWAAGPPVGGYLLEDGLANHMTYSTTPAWTNDTCAACSAGREHTSSAAGATATITMFQANTAGLILSTGPDNGQAQIKLDGVVVGTVNTHAATAGFLTVSYGTPFDPFYGPHTLVVTNLGTTGHPQIQLDATAVLYGAQPGAPFNLSVVGSDAQATVSWAAASASGGPITSYTVTANPGGLTCTTAGLSCSVTGLTNGTSYTFTVQATNSYGPGLVSDPTDAVTPAGVPDPPGSVAAVSGDTKATVSWAQPNSEGSTITSYKVTANPSGLTCTTSSTTCTVNGLTNGTSYTFTVTATNGVGTSNASNPSNAVVPIGVPFPPTGAAATVDDGQSTVSWNAANPNGSPVISYTATASPGGQNCVTAGLSCAVTGLANGTTYTFTVTATNAAGTSLPSTQSNAVVPYGLPTTPTFVTAAAGDTEAGVSWTAANANGSPITSYTVTANPGAVTCISVTTNCTVTGLVDGITYTFSVTATNAAGTGPTSADSNAVTPSGVAPIVSVAPSVTLSTTGKLGGTTPTASVGVTVSWGVTAGIAPVCSEDLQRSTNGGHTWQEVKLATITATSANTTIPAGTATRFRVQATGCDALPSGWVRSTAVTAQIVQESGASFTSGWASSACAACSGGMREQTSTAGAKATYVATGVQSIALVLALSPADGKATAAVDSGTPTTVNTHTAKITNLKFGYTTSWPTDGNHTIVLTNLATSGHPQLQLDAIVTLK